MKLAIVTYVYPNAIKFIPEFVDSVLRQTSQKFELIIFNDGLIDAGSYFEEVKQDKSIVPVDGTPLEIRLRSLVQLRTFSGELLIFQDIDDGMAEDRVEVASKALGDYDVVVNDLTVIDPFGKIQSEKIWESRIPNRFTFDHNFIKNKNIVGLGNTSIRRAVLDTHVISSSLPQAPDWFIFYQLLEKGNLKCCFTSETVTLYRQHDENIAGIGQMSLERLKYTLRVKQAHYAALSEIGYDFEIELQKTKDFIEGISGSTFASVGLPEQLFWWEENYLNI